MSVIAETLEIVKQRMPGPQSDIRIEDVAVGVFFTGVKLSTGQGGAAFTPVAEIPEAVCCPTTAARMPQAGALDGKPVSEILPYSLDRNVLKSAIGIAALNAVSQVIIESRGGDGFRTVRDEDGFDLLNIQPWEKIAMVGAFGPYIRRLKTMGNHFFIIEKNPQTLRPEEMRYYRGESEMGSAIEDSDVVILTGTAIVNHSIDAILSHLTEKKRTAIIGPTASLLPDAFFKRSVNVMAGVQIADPDRMIKILKQGGSAYHLLKDCSRKIAFVKEG